MYRVEVKAIGGWTTHSTHTAYRDAEDQADMVHGRVVPDRLLPSTYSGDWRVDAHAINGQEGSHYDLAAWVESKGFEVDADNENNERSIIRRPGPEDGGEREIGEILGDDEAKVCMFED